MDSRKEYQDMKRTQQEHKMQADLEGKANQKKPTKCIKNSISMAN